MSTTQRNGVPKIKKEINPKGRLQRYDNKVPGPGSCTYVLIADAKKSFVDANVGSYRDNHNKKKTYSSFGIGVRMKSERPNYLGPGS